MQLWRFKFSSNWDETVPNVYLKIVKSRRLLNCCYFDYHFINILSMMSQVPNEQIYKNTFWWRIIVCWWKNMQSKTKSNICSESASQLTEFLQICPWDWEYELCRQCGFRHEKHSRWNSIWVNRTLTSGEPQGRLDHLWPPPPFCPHPTHTAVRWMTGQDWIYNPLSIYHN